MSGDVVTVRTYRKRPTTIEALRWTGENWDEVSAWCSDHVAHYPMERRVSLFVKANDAWLLLERGEWIARDRHGFYPIKDDVFIDSYEEVQGDHRS